MSGKPSSEPPAEQKPSGCGGGGGWMVRVREDPALAITIAIILAVPA